MVDHCHASACKLEVHIRGHYVLDHALKHLFGARQRVQHLTNVCKLLLGAKSQSPVKVDQNTIHFKVPGDLPG